MALNVRIVPIRSIGSVDGMWWLCRVHTVRICARCSAHIAMAVAVIRIVMIGVVGALLDVTRIVAPGYGAISLIRHLN